MKFLCFLLLATPCAAQSLTKPLVAFSSLAALDAMTTYQSLARGNHERNPLLGLGHDKPIPTVALNASSDVASALLWTMLARRGHPRAASVGLYTTAVVRLLIVRHNFQTLSTLRH